MKENQDDMRLYFIAGILAICAFAVGCKQKEPPTSAEKQRAVESRNGIAASIAAAFNVDAVRACRVAGISDIEKCAKTEGTLLPEREARAMAAVSVRKTRRYFDSCIAKFSAAYCNDLIARAIEMEWRKPVTAAQGESQPVNLER